MLNRRFTFIAVGVAVQATCLALHAEEVTKRITYTATEFVSSWEGWDYGVQSFTGSFLVTLNPTQTYVGATGHARIIGMELTRDVGIEEYVPIGGPPRLWYAPNQFFHVLFSGEMITTFSLPTAALLENRSGYVLDGSYVAIEPGPILQTSNFMYRVEDVSSVPEQTVTAMALAGLVVVMATAQCKKRF